jgi:hypothetical protein
MQHGVLLGANPPLFWATVPLLSKGDARLREPVAFILPPHVERRFYFDEASCNGGRAHGYGFVSEVRGRQTKGSETGSDIEQ